MRTAILLSAVMISKSINETIVNGDKGVILIFVLLFFAWDLIDYYVD